VDEHALTTRPGAAEIVPITREPIRLGQFLKLAGAIGSGSDAKGALEAGGVRVNGAEERRRGRSLRRGDRVEIAGRRLQVG
jgi:ribosome-associated protein